MLEKDIENLLVKYPSEFLPKSLKFEVRGQQNKLGSYYADIIFEDMNNNLIVAEIKRGILKRDALGQAMEYYGLLKKSEPDKKIRLMLVANVIPSGMKTSLRDFDIEFLEISPMKIRNIASKYNYRFLDSEKPESIKKYKNVVQKMNLEAETFGRRVWIFQANPQRYDVLNALADDAIDEYDTWLVSRYQNLIRKGHLGLIWVSGKEGGIYAVVDITSDPQLILDSEKSTKYWISEEDKRQKMIRVTISYKLKLVNNPLLREELKAIPQLQNMEIFRRPIGTNFKVNNAEWQSILKLLTQRYNFKE